MQKKRNSDKYFKVVVNEGSEIAEMFLYGYIGQDFWWDEALSEESITDLSFLKSFRKLERDYKRINIRINSPGGSVMHGDPIISAILASPSEVHTYVDGIAASMAFDIWLSGHQRHVSVNSKLMCHATSTMEFGTAKQMRLAAERLEKFDEAAIQLFASVTNYEEEEIREMFYADYEDHWMTAKDALELGLVANIESYEVKLVVPEPEKMSYMELLRNAAMETEKQSESKTSKPEDIIAVEEQKQEEEIQPVIDFRNYTGDYIKKITKTKTIGY